MFIEIDFTEFIMIQNYHDWKIFFPFGVTARVLFDNLGILSVCDSRRSFCVLLKSTSLWLWSSSHTAVATIKFSSYTILAIKDPCLISTFYMNFISFDFNLSRHILLVYPPVISPVLSIVRYFPPSTTRGKCDTPVRCN